MCSFGLGQLTFVRMSGKKLAFGSPPEFRQSESEPTMPKRKRGGKQGTVRATQPSPSSSSGRVSSERKEIQALIRKDNSGEPPLVLTSSKRRGIYECDYCHSDISQVPRIRCAVCPDFDLCLDCFATTDHSAAIKRLKDAVKAHEYVRSGKDVGSTPGISAAASNHDLSHGYRVADSTRYPIFPSARAVTQHEKTEAKASPTVSTQESQASSSSMDIDPSNNNDKKGEKDGRDQTAGQARDQNTDTPSPPSDAMFVQEDPKSVWTVEEDLRLLDAISTCGLGNWADIAEAISGQGSNNKTPKRCMERYFDDFLGRYGHVLPPYTIVEDEETHEEDDDVDEDDGPRKRRRFDRVSSLGAAALTSGRRGKKMKVVRTSSLPGYDKVWPNPYIPPIEKAKLGQDVDRDFSTRAELNFVRAVGSAATKEEAEEIRKDWVEKRLNKPKGPTVLPMRPEDLRDLPGSELGGCMPRRGDFDMEYENDAEQVLADMEFSANDSPQDRALKIQVIQIYNSRLDERERRKQFVVSRKLLDYRKNQVADAKLPRDERDLLRRLRLFERLHTPEEHQQFVEGILKAKRLRKEIAKLQMYRGLGIRTLAEAEKYELDKERRECHKRAQLQKEIDTERAETGAKAGSRDSAGSHGVSALDDDVSSSLWKQYKTSDRKNRRSINRTSPGVVDVLPGEAGDNPPTDLGPPGVSQPPPGEEDQAGKDAETVAREPGPDESKEATANPPKEPAASEEDVRIKREPGYELLTVKEVALCKKLDLKPAQYLNVKKVLIQQSMLHGLMDRETPGSSKRSIVKIDAEKKGNVVDFMVRAGWISSKQTTAG